LCRDYLVRRHYFGQRLTFTTIPPAEVAPAQHRSARGACKSLQSLCR